MAPWALRSNEKLPDRVTKRMSRTDPIAQNQEADLREAFCL